MKKLFVLNLISLNALAGLSVPKECLSPENYYLVANQSYDQRTVVKPATPAKTQVIIYSPVYYYPNSQDRQGCFGKGTLVKAKENGKTVWKKIESISIGDTVYSYDHNMKEIVLGEVEQVRQLKKPVCQIKAGSTTINATPDHPFYSATEDKYLPVGNMLKNSGIITQYSKKDGFDAVLVNSVTALGEQVVYDIRVKDYHNFFVNGNTLVHNW